MTIGGPIHIWGWILVAISASIQFATGLLHDIGPTALHAWTFTIPLVLFAFAHGSVIYGLRSMIVFAANCIVVTNVIEHVNILTGFPGGSYHYTGSLGPRLLLVPLLAGPAYFGVGYLAWMMSQLMLGDANRDWSRRTMFQVPLIASFLMVAWNLSSDPLLSTLRQAWIWRDGGSYFGVPVINFFSWYLTTYIFFQLFSFYLVKTIDPPQKIQATREYWYQPVTLYGSIACMLMLTGLSAPAAGSVTDPAGVVWNVHEIYAVCALVCTFTMGAFTLLAFLNVSRIPASR